MAAAKHIVRSVKGARTSSASDAVSKSAAPQAQKAKAKSAWAILRDKRAKERWEWEEYNRVHHIKDQPYPGTKEFWVQWRINKAKKAAAQAAADAAASAKLKAQIAASR